MQNMWFICALFVAVSGAQSACANPLPLFTQLTRVDPGDSQMPEDSLALWDSSLDVTGLAGMPTEVGVLIPRDGSDVAVTIHLQRMDRRDGR